ncbi:MAG: SUMF1/EgtB/PvdO family nonheme iron enzyme [Myxococcaceae bacterium]|nr:SUMF1/EgtB/PvdO family nonheme iron enzyme [Myxococcaceae bacterium]
MLCYKCGSHVPDTSDSCPNCGQKLAGGGVRQATATFSRRKLSQSVVDGAPFKPQDLVANRYLIKDTVALGPLGYLFRAHDKEIDVEVALKVINPKLVQTADERKHFAKHIRLARKLSHPNLVRVYEEGEDQDRPYYTSQYLDGLTLRKIIDLRLAKGQFFNIREIEPILLQIANALDAAHKVGPHSDIKPDNVLVLPDLLKVTDFGVGLAMPRLPFVQAMKARRADRYLAPELVEGRDVDLRADIYSMAVILGEMLSGLTPDGAMPELQRRNPEVPQALEGLYRRALNQNPTARFKTAGEFMSEIQSVSASIAPPPLKSRESAIGTVSPQRPRSSTGVGALQLSPRREKPPPPVPDMPPPPPDSSEMVVGSAEIIPPDATQPVAEEHLRSALESARNGEPPPPPEDGREPTQIIDSGQLIADDKEETAIRVEAVQDPEPSAPPPRPPPPDDKNRTVIWLVLLTVLGVGIGAGGGYYLLMSMRQRNTEQTEAQRRLDEARRAEEAKKAEQARIDEAIAKKQEEERLAAAKKDEEEAAKKERERLAAEQKAAEKELLKTGLADKAAREKAEREAKAAADREAKASAIAAEKAEKERLAREKKEREKAEKAEKVAVVSPPPPQPDPVATKNEGPCGEGMRMVAGGAFKMGTAADDPMMGFDERKLSSVDVAAFCIDLFEFPNKRGVSPTVNLPWADAKRLCEGKGKRLCSEEEWEKACKGPGNARWPFGNTFDSAACNTEDEGGEKRSLVPSGRFGKCRSGYAVGDMAGNASEWTSEKLVKGGSFASSDYAVRCSARRAGGSISRSGEIGFRCCQDPKN